MKRHTISLLILWLFIHQVSLSPTTTTFNYTGGTQNYTVPGCVTSITVTVAGAQGGGYAGGFGASITAVLNVTPGQVLQIKVGGAGNCPGAGFGGGAAGGNASNTNDAACGGGGATSILAAPYTPASALIIAAGGGGMGGGSTDAPGGAGGCAAGNTGGFSFGQPGGGGTQTAGGAGGPPWISSGGTGSSGGFGVGGAGATDPCYNLGPGGGGGGGYYGGGGGGSDCFPSYGLGGGGGGGGSSLIPAGGICSTGVQAGNGFVSITAAPGTPTITVNSATVCAGQSATLTATVTPAGGTYTWNPGGLSGSSNVVTPATTTTYTILYNNAGCSGSTTAVVQVNPASMTVTPAQNSVTCFGGTNGTATMIVSGGTPGYTYTWSPTGGNSANATNLIAGTYTVQIKDANGCPTTKTVTITQPNAITLTATQTQSISCSGGNNGAASANATGGTGAYTYTWLPTGGNAATASNLTAGTYTVQVKDVNNCTTNTTVVITQPTTVTVTAVQTTSISCNGGNNGVLTANASGGMGGYTYTWSPSGGNASVASNLSFGSYTVQIKDINNCTATAVVNAIQPSSLTLNVAQTTSVACNGGATGIASTTLTGGIGAYSYTWSPTGGNAATANGLIAGTYTITVKDANNCTTSKTVTIVQPPAITLTAAQSASVSCNGGSNGSAIATASGGAGGFSYTWTATGGNAATASNLIAGIYTVTIKDINNCTSTATTQILQPTALNAVVNTQSANCTVPGSATVTVNGGVAGYTYTWSPSGGNSSVANNLNPGTYTCTIKDVNNCTLTATGVVAGPPAVTITGVNTTSVICNGGNNGSATVNVSGGALPYTYTWSPTGGNNATASNLIAGNYTITVKDGNNCTATGVASINQPPSITLTASQTTSISCNGGNNGVATANASGGIGAFTYTWSPVGGNSSVANNLTVGTYTIQIKDVNQCTATAVTTITQPPALSITINSSSVSCNGGNNANAVASVSGGMGSYGYAWLPSGGSASVAANLAAGNYSVNVTDGNGCTISGTTSIVQPPALSITVSQTSVTCNGYTNGTASATLSGGVGGYNYNWAPAGGTGSAATNLGSGSYTVTVTDANNCFIGSAITITQPTSVSLIVSPSTTICFGQSTNITATAGGGNGTYTYNWINNSSLSGGGPISITPTVTTSYPVYATDVNGCFSPTLTINITVTQPLTAIGMQTTVCHGDAAIIYPTITSNGTGGPYTYSWSPGVQGGSTGTVIGNYNNQPNIHTLSISDGCSSAAIVNFTVNVNPLPVGSFSADVVKGCVPFKVNLAASSGNPGDQYHWSYNGNQGGFGSPFEASFNAAGSYSVGLQITNSFGCKRDTFAFNYINGYNYPKADFEPSSYDVDMLEPKIQFTNLSTDAVSYLWDFGTGAPPTNTSAVINPAFEYSYPGTYTVYLLASNPFGCTNYTTKVIKVNPEIHLYVPNAFTPNDDGNNDVFLPKGLGIQEEHYKMQIFDRWGEVVYTSTEFSKGWDGKIKGADFIKADVYVYKITCRDINGKTLEFVGHVTVYQ